MTHDLKIKLTTKKARTNVNMYGNFFKSRVKLVTTIQLYAKYEKYKKVGQTKGA